MPGLALTAVVIAPDMIAALATTLVRTARLYEQLIVIGGLLLADHPDLTHSAAARELVDKGFARERHVGQSAFVPVAPARAIDNAVLTQQRQLLDQCHQPGDAGGGRGPTGLARLTRHCQS